MKALMFNSNKARTGVLCLSRATCCANIIGCGQLAASCRRGCRQEVADAAVRGVRFMK
jgi:hypothetical protein